MARPRGRKRTIEGLSETTTKNLPKEETQEMRQMRSFYLSLPAKERTFATVAREFNCDHDKVWRISRAFNWIDDAQARDAAIIDPFVEQNQKEIDAFRQKALAVACKHLDNELMRLGIGEFPNSVKELIDSGEIELATEQASKVILGLPIKAKDYKDISNLVDLIRKIVFEWNPNQMPKPSAGGGKGVEFHNCNLIIERGAGPTGRPQEALPMIGASQ